MRFVREDGLNATSGAPSFPGAPKFHELVKFPVENGQNGDPRFRARGTEISSSGLG
jgi:hypothetical protein